MAEDSTKAFLSTPMARNGSQKSTSHQNTGDEFLTFLHPGHCQCTHVLSSYCSKPLLQGTSVLKSHRDRKRTSVFWSTDHECSSCPATADRKVSAATHEGQLLAEVGHTGWDLCPVLVPLVISGILTTLRSTCLHLASRFSPVSFLSAVVHGILVWTS